MSKPVKRLTRSRDDKWFGGVCGGLAEYTGVDANLIRILVAVCTLLGAGSLIIAYIVSLFLIPLEDKPTVVVQAPSAPTS
ncbi:MAG: PspC domain-containing protein [Actinomycetota bacterium]|nr:PspC domain-containing protein [Actinomycetota bacterium]